MCEREIPTSIGVGSGYAVSAEAHASSAKQFPTSVIFCVSLCAPQFPQVQSCEGGTLPGRRVRDDMNGAPLPTPHSTPNKPPTTQ